MKAIKKQCALIALNHPTIKLDLRDLDILGLPYQSLIGCYKGIEEISYLVTFSNDNDLANIKSLAIDRSQESILIQRPDGSCYLDYLLNTSSYYQQFYEVGQLKPVSREVAINQDSWTFNPETNEYWICQ